MTAPNARFGKANAKGRSSGIRSGREGKALRPPKGEPFVWLTRELLTSAAWREMSVSTRRLIDFLMVEHMNHAGTNNGNLIATHEQLRKYGLSGNTIREAIEEAKFLGLISYRRGGRWALTNQPSRFRLTFQADINFNLPTNEWKRRTAGAVATWKAARSRNRQAQKKQYATRTSKSTVLANQRVPKAGSGAKRR